MSKKPWQINPELTQERLGVLAAVIFRVRQQALDGHEPSRGDNAWVFGTRAYARTCAAFSTMGASDRYPWLGVTFDNNACTLDINSEPIKFFAGDADKPTSRSLKGGACALQEAFSFPEFKRDPKDNDWFWLMAIETYRNGTARRVVLFQANEAGDTRNTYPVPLDTAMSDNVTSIGREGVDLAPPMVAQRRQDQSAEENAAQGSGTDDERGY